MVEEDNFEVEDSENLHAETYGIKDVGMRAYERCLIEGDKEMVPGGRGYKIIHGVEREVTIPNQREIFVNTVKSFSIIMNPFLEDKRAVDIKKRLEENIKDINKARENYNKEITKQTTTPLPTNFKAYGEGSQKKNYEEAKTECILIGTTFEKYKVELYRKKLLILSDLLNLINYFEDESAGS